MVKANWLFSLVNKWTEKEQKWRKHPNYEVKWTKWYTSAALFVVCITTVLAIPVSLFKWQIQTTATGWYGELFPLTQVLNVCASCSLAVVFVACSSAHFWFRRSVNWPFANLFCTPSLHLLCPTSHGALTPHIMFSHSEKYIAEQRQNWQHANRQNRAGYFMDVINSQLSNVVIF